MLGQHPQCYGMPELNLFAEDTLDAMVSRFSGVRQFQMHGLLRAVAQLYGGEQSIASIEMAWRWILKRMDLSTGEVYQELAEHIKPLRVVDKSPVYCAAPENLARLRNAFPDARFLHLLRHPIAQGKSIMSISDGAMALFSDSVDYEGETAIIDPQISWFDVQVNIMEFLADVPESDWLRMRGEDLLNEPERHLAEICRWLGIGDDAAALEAMMHPECSPYAHLGPVGAHLGNDINFLRSPSYRKGNIGMAPLSGPLPWRPDGKGLFPEVREIALALGYQDA